MRNGKRLLTAGILFVSMAVLILDAKTALTGAQEGIQLCIAVVIPSLFPFLFLTVMLPGLLLGTKIPAIKKLSCLCGVPEGAESILVLSFLGGYPTGAGMVAEAYRQGAISKQSAQHMLGFCNNAGPAFLFGMVGRLFPVYAVWILWLIHILSAIFVGIVTSKKSKDKCSNIQSKPTSVPIALNSSLKIMGNICGWVVIFRIIIGFFDRWFLWLAPRELQTAICGLLELSNGIISAEFITHDGLRFILCAAILSFGGLCVSMQTLSVTGEVGFGNYFPGKMLQCIFSVVLSAVAQFLMFPPEHRFDIKWIILFLFLSVGIFAQNFISNKKVVAFCR